MITRPDHVALSVQNLDRSLTFYCDKLGMEVIRILVPGFGGDKLGTVVKLPGCRARIAHLVMDGFMLELFEYAEPPGREDSRTQAGLGYTHMGFASTDVRADWRRLCSEGVTFFSEPIEFRPGVWIVYFYGPDGEVCELRQTEGGQKNDTSDCKNI